ncbi:aminodeoxychorismate lyase [Paraglaciecola aestuariivivens]
MIINGQAANKIDLADRAVQYGDGCFTTMACIEGQIQCFEAHMLRLKLACKKLGITFDLWQQISQNCFELAKQHANCVLKVIISRGQGGRGYNPTGALNASYIISWHELPDYSNWRTQGVELGVSSIQLARQPLLAKIKHLNRLEQVLIKQAQQGSCFDEVLVCDTQGLIVEASMANVFWYKNNQWFTPDCHYAGVEGVMRNQIVAYLHKLGTKIDVVNQPLQVINQAQEMFLCNSLMQIVPVKSLQLADNQPLLVFQTQQVVALQQAMPDILATKVQS